MPATGTIGPSFQMFIVRNQSLILPGWKRPERGKLASEGQHFSVDWEEVAVTQVIIQW